MSQIARIAWTNSRIRAAGFDQGIEKRRTMCGLICEPRPRVKRPPGEGLQVVGLQGNRHRVAGERDAIAVPISIVCVRCAATAQARNGSICVSNAHQPS